jgi:hypothetical protein
MTESEVDEILGCQAGDYRPPIWKKPTWYVSTTDIATLPIEKSGMDFDELRELQEKDLEQWIRDELGRSTRTPRVILKKWWGRQHMIEVAFDDKGQVIHHSLWETMPPRPPRNLLLRIRWWIGW